MHAGILRLIALASSTLILSSCVYGGSYTSDRRTEHYVSPTIEGASQRINLDEVEKAFFSTKGNDLSSWMSAFEKRVNQIYEGDQVVSIDATRETGKLQITGFIENNKQPGFQSGDDKLFSLEQTGDVVNNEMPYRVSDERGHSYHEGSYGLFNNPIVQGLVIGSLWNSAFGPRYYTPFHQVSVLRDYRNTYRSSPDFNSQRTANKSFTSRFKERAMGGGVRSNNSFGRTFGSGTTGTAPARSTGFGTSTTGTTRTRSWGGGGFGSRRSWGGGFRRR